MEAVFYCTVDERAYRLHGQIQKMEPAGITLRLRQAGYVSKPVSVLASLPGIGGWFERRIANVRTFERTISREQLHAIEVEDKGFDRRSIK